MVTSIDEGDPMFAVLFADLDFVKRMGFGTLHFRRTKCMAVARGD